MRRTTSFIALNGLGYAAADRIPVVTIRGGSGPSVVVTANVHGDECTGLHAVHRLIDELDGVRGSVHLMPSLNPSGLTAGTRVVPVDGGDLNRAFPGRKNGDPVDRLAAAVWSHIVGLEPRLLVDLHTDAVCAIPYAIVDRPVTLSGRARREMDRSLDDHAEATGLTVLREYPDDAYLRFNLDRSLAGAVVNRLGVPAVTIEAGPRRSADPDAIDTTVAAVLGVLGHAGVVAAAAPPHPSRVDGGPWRRTSGPRTRFDGVWNPALRPGARFSRGELLGTLRGLPGDLREEIVAPHDGVVVAWAELSWMGTGTVVGTVGIADS